LTFKKKVASYTVRELLELMLLVSDNTASDALLNLAGGPEAVTAFMKTLGIRDLDVSRSTLNMLADWRGTTNSPPEDFSVEKYNSCAASPNACAGKAQNRFYSDIRDTATPDAMTRLVAMVHCGTVLKPESTTLLLKIMERCKTGQSRIRGLIPPGMATANKTGTIGPGIVNDVALLTLPGDAGHLALTIFIKSSDRSLSYQEQTMAQIARYRYDYYFFNGTASAVAASGESCSLQNRICCRKDVR
jgi:beta-lactamase class A